MEVAVLKVCELMVMGFGKHNALFGNFRIVMSSESKEKPFFRHFKTVVVLPVSGGAEKSIPFPLSSAIHAE
jgi:hypothetical protein